MSISSAQMLPQIASAESANTSARSAPAVFPAGTQPSVPTASPAIKSPAEESPAPAPVILSPPSFSTDMQIDNHHQIYYAVVDDSTGDVLFEIPSEALRKIGESLNVPLLGDAGFPTVDVKS